MLGLTGVADLENSPCQGYSEVAPTSLKHPLSGPGDMMYVEVRALQAAAAEGHLYYHTKVLKLSVSERISQPLFLSPLPLLFRIPSTECDLPVGVY